MDHAHLLIFAGAYLAVLVLPGPGVTALVAHVVARGAGEAPAFIAGFIAGSLTWFTAAATGLAVLASAFTAVFAAIRYLGAAYLLSLGWKLWWAPGWAPARSMEVSGAAADRHGRLFRSAQRVRMVNRGSAAVMTGVALTIVAR